MKKFKRSLAIILSLLMIFTAIPVLTLTANAEITTVGKPLNYERTIANFDGIGGSLNASSGSTIMDGQKCYPDYEDGNIFVVPMNAYYQCTGFKIPVDWRAGEPAKIGMTVWSVSKDENEDGTYTAKSGGATKESGFQAYYNTGSAAYPLTALDCGVGSNWTIPAQPTNYVFDMIGTDFFSKIAPDTLSFLIKANCSNMYLCVDNIKVYYRSESKMPSNTNIWKPMYDFENSDLAVTPYTAGKGTITTGTGTDITFNSANIVAAVSEDTSSEDSTKAIDFKKTSYNDMRKTQYITIPVDEKVAGSISNIKYKAKASNGNMAMGVVKDGEIYWQCTSTPAATATSITLTSFGSASWFTQSVGYYTYRAFITDDTGASVLDTFYLNENNFSEISAIIIGFGTGINQTMSIDDIIFECAHAKKTEKQVVAPTCIEQGYTIYTCDICGEEVKADYTASVGHTYGDWIVDKTATCTEQGKQHKVCGVCGDISEEDIPATGHTYGEWVVDTPATCTVEGSQHKDCENCDDVVVESIPAKGHNFGKWIVDTAATCLEDGSQHRVCATCNETETQVIKATGHKLETTAEVPATCTAPGVKSEIKCSVCSKILVPGEVIPPLGHTYTGSWTTTEKAGCVDDGIEERTCDVCHEIEYRTIQSIGHHTPGNTVTVASSSFNYGTKSVMCTVFNEPCSQEFYSMKGIGASYGTTYVKFTWAKDSTATKYIVQQYASSKWTTKKTATGTYATVSSLSQGKTYKFRIYAVKSDGSRTGSIIYKTVTTKLSVGKPSLTAKAATKSAKLSWNKASRASKYQVYQLVGKKWILKKTLSSRSYTVKSLKKGSTYSFKIRAIGYAANKKAYYSSYSSVKKVKAK